MRHDLRDISAKIAFLILTFCSGISVTNAQTPVSNFTGTPLSGCSPLIVVFQDLSSGNPTSWNWNFGNGNTSTLQNPTATYFTPGNYTVTLTTTNANGSNTLTRAQYITVNEPPTVNFDGAPLAGCFPLRVQFNDLSTPGAGNTNTTWSWDFGNGVTSNLQNPLVSYTTAGTFTVTLRVTNDKGCTRAISRPAYITVADGVRAGFTNTNPTVCSAPATINFTNTTTGPGTLTYQWDFGDGSPASTVQDPSHIYTADGSYTVTLIATSSSGCVDTFRNTVPIAIGGFINSFTAATGVCTNEPVTFTNTSTPAPINANWTFGDGGSATGINATYSYATAGTYTVWLYNTYGNCTDSVSQSITINPRPVANFSAPVRTRCQPDLTVNFQDLSTGAVSWQWNFGDGTPVSTTQNPSHTYTNYGDYDVTLIVTNNFGCTDTLVQTAFVRIQRPVITVSGLPTRGCIPYTINPVPTIVTLDAITSYAWDFGDGIGTSTLANPSYTYNAQGTYTVTLTITTSTGCTETLTLGGGVQVGSKPVANFSVAPTPVCANSPVQFTDLTPAPTDTWEWQFGDGGTSTLQNPIHEYSDTGFFNVQLIVTNNGCADTIVQNNVVYVLPPVARFTSRADCDNRLRFTFTDQSVAPLTWEWNFGDGSPLSTVQSPVHVFPAIGTYNVRLIVTNGGCADTATMQIQTVSERPDFTADRFVACKRAGILFTASGFTPSNVTSFEWTLGDGNIVTTPGPAINHLYTTSGTYTVRLVTVDINGCRDTIIKQNYIRINGPVAGIDPTPISGCTGITGTFNDLSTTDGVNAIVNWQWDFGDGSIQSFTAPPFQHTYSDPGTFTVHLVIRDAAGCLDSTAVPFLVRVSDPIPDFISADTLTCPNGTVNFTNTSTARPNFNSFWDFGDGNTSILNSPSNVYTAIGQYNVKLRILDDFGCADSITKNLYIRVDVPHPSFTVSDTAGGCTPLEVQFTNTSTFFSSLLWDFGPGQGTSTLANPIHFYNVPGTYLVKLYVTSPGGCLDSASQNITVYDTTGARLNYAPIGGCSPLSVNLATTLTSVMDSYFWDFGDGNTISSNSPNVNHIYTSFGNFLPKLIMRDPAGCLIALEGLDTVYVIGANAHFGYDRNLLCDAGVVNFSDSTTSNDPVTGMSWNFGDGGTSTLQNPSHQYAGPGFYNVYLAIETQSGCRDTANVPNAIKIVLSPLVDIDGDSVVCVNSSLLHSGVFLRTDTSAVSWAWTFPNGNSSSAQIPPSQTYTAAGTFDVRTIVTNSSGCIDTALQTIIVNPLPQVTMPGQLTIQAGFPVTIPATYSPNTLTWNWTPATGLSCTTCATPEAGPKFNTSYTVSFTDANNCTNTGTIEVIVICKDGNLFIPNTFSPNGDGSNDIFYPRGRGLFSIKMLRIFNRWGEVVFEKRNFQPNDALAGWNGSYKGKKPQADVYVYQCEVFCDNGDTIILNGNISLIL